MANHQLDKAKVLKIVIYGITCFMGLMLNIMASFSVAGSHSAVTQGGIGVVAKNSPNEVQVG
jgi:hypothetical protein